MAEICIGKGFSRSPNHLGGDGGATMSDEFEPRHLSGMGQLLFGQGRDHRRDPES